MTITLSEAIKIKKYTGYIIDGEIYKDSEVRFSEEEKKTQMDVIDSTDQNSFSTNYGKKFYNVYGIVGGHRVMFSINK